MKYSQNNEQEVLLNYFGDFKGTLLDVGCNDCKTLSNSLALIEKGWSGVLVDPSRVAYEKCLKLHKGKSEVYCFNFAIADFCGDTILHESGSHLGVGDTALLSTIKPSELDRWKGSNNEFIETHTQVFDYKTFLKKSPIKTFDFISIDAEGVDLAILQQIDLIGTKVICIEYNSDPLVLKAIKFYCHRFALTKQLLLNGENIILAR